MSSLPARSNQFELIHHVLHPLALVQIKDLKILECNKHFEKVTELLEGDCLQDLFPKSTSKKFRNFSSKIFQDPGRYDDLIIDTKTLGTRVVDVTISPVDQNLCLFFLQDTTEKKNLERDLLLKHQELEKTYKELSLAQETMEKTSRLTALGELAAGISHEINQPLTGIRGFAQELKFHLDSNDIHPETMKIYTDEIVKNVDRMSKIISHLKEFGRQKSYEKKQTSLVEITENALMLFGKQLSNLNVKVEFKKDPKNLFPIYANPYEIEQVMINLISNAKDALSDKESPKITIEIYEESEKFLWVIKDNGCGMDKKTMNRIFEPFFTTKEVGKGMGLGLSISYGILQQNQSEIRVKSEKNKGTEFTLVFERYKP